MTVIKICTGRTCSDHGSAYLFDRFKAETAEQKHLSAKPCPCLGNCENAVNVKVESKGKATIHAFMTGPKIAALVKKIKL